MVESEAIEIGDKCLSPISIMLYFQPSEIKLVQATDQESVTLELMS